MRKGKYQREVVVRLARIEGNLEKISRELAKMVGQRGYPQAVQPSGVGAASDREPDKWLQDGIDNILSYQAGKKREGEQ